MVRFARYTELLSFHCAYLRKWNTWRRRSVRIEALNEILCLHNSSLDLGLLGSCHILSSSNDREGSSTIVDIVGNIVECCENWDFDFVELVFDDNSGDVIILAFAVGRPTRVVVDVDDRRHSNRTGVRLVANAHKLQTGIGTLSGSYNTAIRRY